MNAEIEAIQKELHEAEQAARSAALRVDALLIKMREACARHVAATAVAPAKPNPADGKKG